MRQFRRIPSLRFPAYEGKWDNLAFETIYTFKSTNSLSRDKLNYEKGQVKNIHYGDIHTKFNSIFDLQKEKVPFINEDVDLRKISAENFCKEGDLVIADASEDYNDIGKCIEIKSLHGEKVLAGLHTFLARPEKMKLAHGIGAYIMQSPKVRYQVKIIAQGTKVLGISTGRLSRVQLVLPKYQEQQKIVSFLSSVDAKIQQLIKKKELLEQYKKGVMQKVFKQEIRFKGENGKSYPNWLEKKLGDILSFKSTNSFSRSLLNYEAGLVHNIHYGDIHAKYESLFDASKVKVPFINMDIDLSKVDEESFCRVGDLVIADASEDYKDLGKIIEIINLNSKKLVAGLHTYLARDEKNLTVTGFKGYLMQTHDVRSQIMIMGNGISVLGISKSNLSKVKIKLPSKDEQRKIVDMLMSIDKKISVICRQLSLTKEFKKGLLQQMFV